MDKKITFHGYSIINFTMNKEESTNKKQKNDFEIKIDNFKNDKNANLYKTILKIKVQSKINKIYLELEGIFEFPQKSQSDEINEFLKYYAPSILYPYCRSFISMVTGYDSDETLILPIINFYEQNI